MLAGQRQGNTKDAGSDQPQPTAPTISLPKGGGAIRGIGEKFTANPVTGTGSMSVPLATSPGRSGFGPQLTLSYDSGAGNGPFGLGWSLSLPSITRKTDKGLPKYDDAGESDVFILSGAEDLVPVLVKVGSDWNHEPQLPRTVNGKPYLIQRYRPRIEGLVARIERWTSQTDPADMFWRSISKDNITTWYGKTDQSRIVDSADATRIFSWLISESYDDKGNVIAYQYKSENPDNVDESQAHERNRTPNPDTPDIPDTRKVNRYLKHIRYGNHAPYFPKLLENKPWPSVPANDQWFFEVVFDYGEHHADAPTPGIEVAPWKCRLDPFSSYRSCFEVRTYRLCQRVLMFHHFEGEADIGRDCLVRSTDFTYSYEDDPKDSHNPIHSVLLSVSQCGYKRRAGGYAKKSLPPLEFEYTQADVDETVRDVDPESLENLPYGLDGANYQWVDLDGEGLSGILTEQAQGWFYKRNLSPINIVRQDGKEHTEARFASLEVVAEKPSLAAINGRRQQLLDLAGDGQLDLVALSGPTPGFYERTQDGHWDTFRPFMSLPNVEWNDPHLKFVDLTGDGHADVLVTKDEVFCWYPSLAEEGFGPAERIRQRWDEEMGPRLVFSDAEHSIYLADLSGDGLTDLVRIRNGEVCYWPNLGYGRFGAKVTMDHSPSFDNPDLFDPQRIQLSDIDGSGVTDIIYLGRDGVHLYFNQSGNSWSQPRRLNQCPQIDNTSSVRVVDLLGNGTACLVWSSPLPGDARRPMRYIDLMGGQKPHLLVKSVNNLGAETHVHYAPSTKFYLEDKLAGNPWITKLPFPVHVVERVETIDYLSRNRFVSRYAYHHGYFDGLEREFRGFGMVEQWDTEAFAAFSATGTLPNATNIDEASHVPPALTRTWFHTGAFIDESRISKQFEHEYYREGDTSDSFHGLTDAQLRAMLLDDTVLPSTLRQAIGMHTPYTLATEEVLEACRSLKGAILRQELYALDGTDEADRPYSVSERNYTIDLLQPRDRNKHAVIFTHPREQVDCHYERKLVEVSGQKRADPRVSHAMTLEVDPFGNVLRSVAIGYRRRALPGVDAPEQQQTHLTFTVNRFANRATETDWHRVGLHIETRTYEIVKPPEPRITDTRIDLFRFQPMAALTEMLFPLRQDEPNPAKLWPYGQWDWHRNPVNAPLDTRLRLIEHVRTLYRQDDLSGPHALGRVDSLALPFESYKLAFTPELAGRMFVNSGKLTAAALSGVLADEGKYVHSGGDANWWIPSGRLFYSPGSNHNPTEELAYARQHFFLPHRYRDPFHTNAVSTESFVSYAYDLLMLETRDPLGNRVTVGERTPAGKIDPTKPGHDYRVLQPRLVTDPNRNRAEVVFDALGMVVGTAVKGKDDTVGDTLSGFEPDLTQAQVDGFSEVADPHVPASGLLKGATTRIIYDLDRFRRTRQAHPEDPTQWLPVYAATLARETHVSDPLPPQGLKIQIGFSYSDGFGREIQKKVQAEPGPLVAGGPVVSPRWVGSGWTIFNNKGKPVRQCEPFFSRLPEKRHRFEFGVQVGVSPILFYDPVERVVATLHPNHTYEKVVFDPWRQTTYDVNDTVNLDPSTDDDVKGFFVKPDGTPRIPTTEYLPTWHAQRIGNPLSDPERDAAQKASAHADTPTVAHLDALGRPFVTIAHNRYERNGAVIEENNATRVELDLEGNQREVIDAKDRVVMRYDYDLLGNRIHQASMEAGERWMLNAIAGKPIRAWDSRHFLRRMTYDALRRPTGLYVTESGAERLAECTVYGENLGDAANHRTRVHQVFDGAGIVTSVAYDFKGNLREGRRELLPTYKQASNWLQNPAANDGSFTSRTTYDAINRPLTATSPDGSVYRPTFNEANLLEKVDVNLRGSTAVTPFVTNINYNAKGQRELIEYGIKNSSGAPRAIRTKYTYDPLTFRLTHLTTTRTTDNKQLQDLSYTYDPVGNITQIRDDAQQTIYFRNQVVTPRAEYEYDALYRLAKARGREHLGHNSSSQLNPPPQNDHDDSFRMNRPYPSDGRAMGKYAERYEYDQVGNILGMIHAATSGSWTRHYDYNSNNNYSKNNRLQSTSMLGDPVAGPFSAKYEYDAHGNMTKMPHLSKLAWDFKDQLHSVEQGTEKAYYVYDSSGKRARKVVEKNNGALIEERIYLGSYEIFRRRTGSGLRLEREILHIMDDKKRIAMVETKTRDNGILVAAPKSLTRYQLGNHLDSTNLELDAVGEIISYEEYYPYGSTSYQSMRSGVEVSPKRYRYTSKERDDESGLYYHGARYYVPWLGRWASTDPAALADGPNLYRFARDSPIRFSDANGMQSKSNPTGTSPLDPDPLPKSSVDYPQGIPEAPADTNWDTERKAHTARSAAQKGAQSQGGVYQEHHTLDIDTAKKTGVHPDVAGEPERLITARSRRNDPSLMGDVGGDSYTHHNTAADVGEAVKAGAPQITSGPAKGLPTPEGSVDASATTQWRLRGTGLDPNEKIPVTDSATGQIEWKPKSNNPLPLPQNQILKETQSLERAAASAANAPDPTKSIDSIKVYGVPSPKDGSSRKGGAYVKLRGSDPACREFTLDDRLHGSRISSLAAPF